MTDYEDLQKRCQRGATNLNDANNLLAECYGTLGAIAAERDQLKAENERLQGMLAEWDRSPHGKIVLQNLELRKSLAECTASLEGEVLQKFHGQKPEDMHPVTRREYDRDMAEINGYKALSKEG